MNYLFIGDGRVARHMSHYLSSKGHAVAVWSRRSEQDPETLFQKAQVICVSTRDNEIPGVIEAYKLKSYKAQLVHFSGSQHIEGAIGLHPLMSFGPELYPIHVYEKMHFVGVSPKSIFSRCFKSFNNNYHQIEKGQLALYHSYCAMAGNFPQLLWNDISEKFETDLNLPDSALKPYLEQITANFIAYKSESLTGPLVRDDNKTLIRHLDSLTGNPLQSIYFSFMNLFRKNKKMEKPHESSGISTSQI